MADSGTVDDHPPAGAFAGSAEAVLLSQAFAATTITAVRRAVTARVAAAGLAGESLEGFVLAVHELVANAVRHGGGAGRIHLRQQGDTLICEISDQGHGDARVPAGLPAASAPGGRGLWLAHHLTGDLRIDAGPAGLCVTVRTDLPAFSGGNPALLHVDAG
ncbi:ATP-binding protein [Actinoplanes sp. NEAU-A12]|uniref:ATP-binding protein n=1 Tax=Actinoplanes sandaracinus TaxID=3045177 RepID=A0ABT6WIN6_9ACTN|nr:ATP-binding protein [Actinoplanes sandaracinus]MDI6099598.1 ATP-binding protein [Actinoplanes sandaracinus]